jgi:hypothetical protein
MGTGGPSELSQKMEVLSEGNTLIAANLRRFSEKLTEGRGFLADLPEFSPLYTRNEDMAVDVEFSQTFTASPSGVVIDAIGVLFGDKPQ